MKTAIISSILFIGSAFATPVRRSDYDVNITLLNDETSVSAVYIVPSGWQHTFFNQFSSSDPAAVDGGLNSASRAMLRDVTIDGLHITCEITANGRTQALTSERPVVYLDGWLGPVDMTKSNELGEASIVCIVEGEQV